MTVKHSSKKDKQKDAKDKGKAKALPEKSGKTKSMLKEAVDEAFWDSVKIDKPGGWVDVLKENGELELPDLLQSKRLTSRAREIMQLTGATQFALNEKRIVVGGGTALRTSVAKYVNIIINKMVPDNYVTADFSRVFVSHDFAKGFAQDRGADVEQAEKVLIVVEKSSSSLEKGTFLPGDAVEVETQPGVWKRMATVMEAGVTSVTLRYCQDQSQEEISLSQVRRAISIAIFGPNRNRLAAAIQIAAAFDQESTGAFGALQDNPYFQSRRLGVMSEELPVKAEVVNRLEKSPFLKQIMLATGCILRFFMKAAKAPSKSRKHSSIPCVLAAGSLEQRWRGLQSVKIIALGMEQKRHPNLPPALLGDARRVNIPNDIVSVVVGRRMEPLLELMKTTNTVTWHK